MHTHLKLEPADLTYGTSLYGSTRLFDALCKHYNSTHFAPHLPVQPEHILTAPGCGPLLDQIFEHLADAGDGVLAAAPYYNGFDADLSTRSHVRCLPVFSPHEDGTDSSSFLGQGAMRGFEEALLSANEAGIKTRAVLLCNPSGFYDLTGVAALQNSG